MIHAQVTTDKRTTRHRTLWKGIIAGALPRTPRFWKGIGAISELVVKQEQENRGTVGLCEHDMNRPSKQRQALLRSILPRDRRPGVRRIDMLSSTTSGAVP